MRSSRALKRRLRRVALHSYPGPAIFPMLLTHFDPHDVDPNLLVNREQELGWLAENVEAYLTMEGPRSGRTFCIIGDKGIGKSILTRRALDRVRAKHSASTLIIEIDCRRWHSAREILAAIADAAVQELISLESAKVSIAPELLEAAQILRTIASMSTVTLRVVHERLQQYKIAAKFGASLELLKALDVGLGISLQRSEKSIEALEGITSLDEVQLLRMFRAFFNDLHDHDLYTTVYIDNLDELRHSYRTEADRDKVRSEIGHVLALHLAPIALVLNARTYFETAIPRSIKRRRILGSLTSTQLREIVAGRIAREPEAVRRVLLEPAAQEVIQRLATMASTPMALLVWFGFLVEEDALSVANLRSALDRFVETLYTTVPLRVLREVVRVFPTPTEPIDRAALLEGCGNNEAILAQLQDRQVVLPRDFWNPTEFTLDPEIQFLHPSFWLA